MNQPSKYSKLIFALPPGFKSAKTISSASVKLHSQAGHTNAFENESFAHLFVEMLLLLMDKGKGKLLRYAKDVRASRYARFFSVM